MTLEIDVILRRKGVVKRTEIWSILIASIIALLFIWGNGSQKNDTDASVAEKSSIGKKMVVYPIEGFQADDFTVSIEIQGGLISKYLDIYYTLDGSIPTLESHKYDVPIEIDVSNSMEILTIRASIMQDGKLSSPITKTYFIGREVEARFDLPVVSITVPEESLYDYEKGIFVTGATYDNWLAEGGSTETGIWNAETNFSQRGDEWKREAYIEVYSAEGEKLVDMNGFISVAGKGTAPYPIKSLNITSDSSLENGQSLFYNFVAGEVDVHEEYMWGEWTDSIRLRNGGNDFKAAQIRQSVCNELAYTSGIRPVSLVTPVVVFLNGEYYWVLYAQNNYSKYNISHMLGEGIDQRLIEKEEPEKECELFGDCSGNVDYCHADFYNDEIRKEFEEKISIDSLIKYYAIEMLLDNTDWPERNYSVFRYTGPQIEQSVYSDGKYRFLFYDTDYCFERYTYHEDIFRMHFDDNAPEGIKVNHPFLMTNMVKYEPYKRRFVNQVCDYMNSTFTADNVESVINEKYENIKNEVEYMQEIDNDTLQDIAKDIPKYVEELKDNAYERLVYDIPQNLQEYLGVGDKFNISVNVRGDGGYVQCNSLQIVSDNNFSGTYYTNCPIEIQVVPHKDYEILGINVNGQRWNSEKIFVTEDMIIDNEIEIEVEFGR